MLIDGVAAGAAEGWQASGGLRALDLLLISVQFVSVGFESLCHCLV
jgi:hypothetical protein